MVLQANYCYTIQDDPNNLIEGIFPAYKHVVYEKPKGYNAYKYPAPIAHYDELSAVKELLELSFEEEAGIQQSEFKRYQKDPVGFCERFFKEFYPDDIKKVMRSVAGNKITLAKSANGVGKCSLFSDLIELADGSLVMAKDLIGRDFELYSINEKLNSSLNIKDKFRVKKSKAYATDNGLKEVIKITTSSGRQITRTLNHPLLTCYSKFQNNKTPIINNLHWKQVSDIKVGDLVAVVKNSYYRGDKEQDLRLIKVLAYLIADGHLGKSSIYFSNTVKEVLTEIEESLGYFKCKLGYTNKNNYQITTLDTRHFSINPLNKFIKDIGLWNKRSNNKFIPNIIYQLPNEQLAVFLSRLFSTDGYLAINRNNAIDLGYSSTSLRLVEDLQRLLLRFGITSSIKERKTFWNYKGVRKEGTAYCLSIYGKKNTLKFINEIGFYDHHKKAKALEAIEILKDRNRSLLWQSDQLSDDFIWEKVTSIEILGLQPTVAISVPGDHTYLTTYVEHNTHVAARLCIWFLKCFPGSKIYTCAAPPEDNLRKNLWGEIFSLVEKFPDLFEGMHINGLNIVVSATNFLTGVTIPSTGDSATKQAKFAGKHAPALMFIIDEGDGVPEEVYKAIESCMSGGLVLKMLVLYNPRQQAGILWKMEQSGNVEVITLSAFNHPNVTSGVNKLHGAVTREVTVERTNLWTVEVKEGESTDTTCFELPRFLEGEKCKGFPPLSPGWRRIINPDYYIMVLGIYPNMASNQLISINWIDDAVARQKAYIREKGAEYIKLLCRPKLGLDVAEVGDNNALASRHGNFLAPIKVWNNHTLAETRVKVTQEYFKQNAEDLSVDGTGNGAGIVSEINQSGVKIRANSVKVRSKPLRDCEFGSFQMVRDELLYRIREWISTPYAMIPDDQELKDELASLTFEVDKGIKVIDKKKLKKKLSRSPDKLDAFALTFYQTDDDLLHFYEYCFMARLDKTGVEPGFINLVIKGSEGLFGTVDKEDDDDYKNKDIFYKFNLKSIVDIGFLSYSIDRASWSIIRLWYIKDLNYFLIVDIWRSGKDDTYEVVDKIYQSNKKRKFDYLGLFLDSYKFIKTAWNKYEEDIYKRSGGKDLLPSLNPVNLNDRKFRQSELQNKVRDLNLAVLEDLTSNKFAWGQLIDKDSHPDDVRDAMAGIFLLGNKIL